MTSGSFVVLTHGRTGSSLLVQSLIETGVDVFGEMLHEDAESRSDAARGAAVAYCPEQDGAAFLRDFYDGGAKPRGFKLFYEQARDGRAASAWNFLKDRRDVKVIHIVRQNLLAAWTSYEIAFRTGVWQSLPDHPPAPDLPPFEINAAELGRFFDRIVAQRDWVRQTFRDRPYIEVEYESGLRDNFGSAMRQVLEFLGSGHGGVPPPVLRRMARRDLRDQISNFLALQSRFRYGPHAEHFEPFPEREGGHPGFCSRPFEFLSIDSEGKLRVCCEDWLPTPVGDVKAGPLREQWNSPAALAIRQSILDGSYRFCNKKLCPDLVKRSLPDIQALPKQRHREWVSEGRTVMRSLPRTLSLGYDASCNLKCPTCRSSFIVLKGRALEEAERTHREVLETLMPSARTAIITGQGDAVASSLYRGFLQSFDAASHPELGILLMSNGLALTPRMWESFGGAHKAIKGLSVSVDAATPATYAVNRGGKFEKLMCNLDFLGGLRRRGALDYLELSFVVQANNFREMPEFIRLARRIGCTSVLFMKLVRWPGTFDAEEMVRRAVHLPQHPLHRDFREILADPIFGDPDVDLSNLAELRAMPPARGKPEKAAGTLV